jgi:superfamily II DNA or RNA helicase
MEPSLRDYQVECVESIFKEWKEVISTLAVIPTGGGKSAIAAEVIRRVQPKRAMFVCHRAELVYQFRNTLARFAGLDAGIEMADLYVNESLFGDLPVVIATVQTLNSELGDRTRMSRFKPMEFGVLVCDEAHHVVAPTWKNVINYFTQNPELRVLNLTATPDRADEEALGQIIDSVACDIEILDMIHRGWLVPVQQQFVAIEGLDFSAMRTTAGDLNGADLAKEMESEGNLQGVAGASIHIIGNRRAIVFTVSVAQAEALCSIFNRHKEGMAGWVEGKTNDDERRELLQRFQDGKVQVVCNCGVLTEGFDNPGVEVVVMARPTKSRALYAQMAGRSTRPLPGIVDLFDTPEERKDAIAQSAKPHCLIVDFVGNSGKHKLMSSADILGGKVSDEVLERAVERAKKLGKPVAMTELIDEEEDAEKKRLLERDRRKMAELRKRNIVANVKFTTKQVNPFDVFDIQPARDRGWDYNKQLSDKEKGLLVKQGINPDQLSYAQGKQIVRELFRRWNGKLCTMRQAKCLKKFGYEIKDLKMADASKLIAQLEANHWKRPQEPPKPAPSNAPF